jgi:phage terminase Nu1 subunit (DNA packaging protein)
MSDDDWLEHGPPCVPVHGLDKRDLSLALDKPLKAIDKMVREGLPVRSTGTKRGGLRFDLPTVIEWIAAERAAAVGGDGNSVTDAKRRLAVAQAGLKELERAKLEGELFPVKVFERLVSDIYTKFRARLQSLPLEVTDLSQRQHAQFEEAIHDALSDISAVRFSEALELEFVEAEPESERVA